MLTNGTVIDGVNPLFAILKTAPNSQPPGTAVSTLSVLMISMYSEQIPSFNHQRKNFILHSNFKPSNILYDHTCKHFIMIASLKGPSLSTVHSNLIIHPAHSNVCVQCRTRPFISKAKKISGPKQAVTITDHFMCISANLTYCITCTL